MDNHSVHNGASEGLVEVSKEMCEFESRLVDFQVVR